MKNANSAEALQREAIEWLLTLDSPECSQTEREAFQSWLSGSKEHQRVYWQVSQGWDKLGRFKDRDFAVRREALQARPAKHRRVKPYASWATAAGLMLFIGYATFSSNGWYGQAHHYQTLRGQRQNIQLADGSSIELSADSELRTRLNRNERLVELLRGEAYFTVKHDAERPFVVTAVNGEITDIGTRFDVRVDDAQVEVAVEEGSVRIDAAESRTLQAGQIAAYDQRGQFVETGALDVKQRIAWRSGLLIFQNQPLHQVIAELQRYHDVSVSLASPSLAKLKVSGTFHTDNLDNALNVIAMTLPVQIRRSEAGDVILTGR